MASAWCMALAAHPLGRLVESPEDPRSVAAQLETSSSTRVSLVLFESFYTDGTCR